MDNTLNINILNMLAELKHEIQLIGEDVKSIIENVDPQVKFFDDRLTLLEIEVDSLAQQTVRVVKASRLQSRELNILKQQALSLNFVLYGFPPKITGEQLIDALSKFGELIGETFAQSDLRQLKAAYVEKSNETKIIGTFYLQEKKDRVFHAYSRHHERIYAADIVRCTPQRSPFRESEIRLKNQLIPYYAHLLEEARSFNECLPNHQRFTFIWESSGRILLKKRETSKSIIIFSMEDFHEIVSRMP